MGGERERQRLTEGLKLLRHDENGVLDNSKGSKF